MNTYFARCCEWWEHACDSVRRLRPAGRPIRVNPNRRPFGVPDLKLSPKATPTEIARFLVATSGYIVRTKDRFATAYSRNVEVFSYLVLDTTVKKMIEDGLLRFVRSTIDGKSNYYELTDKASAEGALWIQNGSLHHQGFIPCGTA